MSDMYVKEWLTLLIFEDMKIKAIMRSLKKSAYLINEKMMTPAQCPPGDRRLALTTVSRCTFYGRQFGKKKMYQKLYVCVL